MSLRALAIATLLSNYLALLTRAAVITIYTTIAIEPTGGPGFVAPPVPPNAIVTVTAIDVLPGNITEYAAGEAFTAFPAVGSGTAESISASVTSFSYYFEEGASFIGNSFSYDEFSLSGSALQTISTPITGVAGCTVTALPSATGTQFHCAQVQVFGDTSTTTIFYTETASPVYTLTEPMPPPTASATTRLLFPSGVPTGTSGSKQLRIPFGAVLLVLITYYGLLFPF